MHLNNRMYDVLKWITQIFLPAVGTLYFSVAGIWGLPAAQQVVGTIVALTTFLGVILGLSTLSYNKSGDKYDGSVNVERKDDGTPVMALQLDKIEDPHDIVKKKEVTFKVNSPNT